MLLATSGGRRWSAAGSASISAPSARTRRRREALGVDAFRYKMLAMVLSSFLTGLGGTFYAFYLLSLQPGAVFGIPLSVEIILRPIVGGAGTLLGPILGSFILTPARRAVARLLRPERAAAAPTSSSTARSSSPWCCSCRRARFRFFPRGSSARPRVSLLARSRAPSASAACRR